jgi:hypothetical protein
MLEPMAVNPVIALRYEWRVSLHLTVITDFRFALRQLLKSPGFTFLALFTLASRDRLEHSDLQSD